MFDIVASVIYSIPLLIKEVEHNQREFMSVYLPIVISVDLVENLTQLIFNQVIYTLWQTQGCFLRIWKVCFQLTNIQNFVTVFITLVKYLVQLFWR